MELHENTYDPTRDTLTWSGPRAAAHAKLEEYYRAIFSASKTRGGAQAQWITDREDIRKLTAFFAWTAWTATANRPGYSYS